MNSSPINTQTLVRFLSTKSKNDSFIQRLKIGYRPLICPFVDLLTYAKSTPSAFDIGCGAGQFCLLLAEYTPVKKIAGIEIKEALIQEAKKLLVPYKNKVDVNFYTFNGETIPEELSQFELIYLIDVFHHVPKKLQDSFLNAVYEKMKPGATFILKDIDASSPLVFMNKLHDLVFAKEIGNEYSFNKMEKLVKEIGFSIQSSSKKRMWWYPHFTFVLKK